jgi:hypothetical protein
MWYDFPKNRDDLCNFGEKTAMSRNEPNIHRQSPMAQCKARGQGDTWGRVDSAGQWVDLESLGSRTVQPQAANPARRRSWEPSWPSRASAPLSGSSVRWIILGSSGTALPSEVRSFQLQKKPRTTGRIREESFTKSTDWGRNAHFRAVATGGGSGHNEEMPFFRSPREATGTL